MTKVRKTLFVTILGIPLLLTGCWDVKNIENLNIPIASGYEIVRNTDTGTKRMETFGVFPVLYENAPKKTIVDIIQSEHIGEARSIRMQHLGGELSLGGIQTVVLGSNLAREGVRNALNIVLRTAQMKGTVTIAVAEDNIKDIFAVEPDNYPDVGVYLKVLLDDAFRLSFIPKSDLHHVSVAMYTPGWHPIIPMLKVKDKKIIINSYGIFKDDKLAHIITIPEARILSILSNMPSSGEWTYSITDNNNIHYSVTVRMENSTKIKVSRNSEGYHINVSIKSKGELEDLVPNINYYTSDNNLFDKENLLENKTFIEEIEKGYEELLRKKAEALVYKAQNEFKMDIFNWVKYAQAKWRKDIDSIDWDDCFSNMNVNIDVNANVEYIGEET